MRKKLFSIILSLAIMLTMIPMVGSVAFAESAGTTNISIKVCEPVPGQPYEPGYTIEGIDYTMELQYSEQESVLGYFNYCNGWSSGHLFEYDTSYKVEACILCPSIEDSFTGSYTATVNGHPANVKVSEDHYSIYISYDFKTGSREPIEEVWLDGYKPVKAGTTPAKISLDTEHPNQPYTANGYYSMEYYSDEVQSFIVDRNYQMRISVEAPYSYTFEGIKPENIHIKGYDKPLANATIYYGDGSFAHGYLEETPSYLTIILPAEPATMNEFNFTVPAPVEGELPGQATLKENDDITCTETIWYKSPAGWFNSPDTVKMKDGERFEAGYDYYAQPKYSWKGEELAPGSYTIKVNGDTYNGEYCSFSHLYREIDLKITVAEPKVGNTPAQTFSADIPISNQVCRWYFLPNAPSTDGFQPMEPTDKFALGCCYAFLPGFNYDKNFYNFNRIYVNGVDISEIDFMMFGPLAKQTQAIKNVNSTYSKAYGTAFTLKPTSATSRTYKSSNTKIATVSSAGKVTIKGIGTAKITITAAEDATYRKVSKTVEIKAVPKTAAVS
ncbi:MAG: Ig-like domain-containing protein, partial [Mogibacterium sp.]|nr:Ig-like domain-containing protein [Mogibacterium sp.]